MIVDVSLVAVAMTAVINLAFAALAGMVAASFWLKAGNAPSSTLPMRRGIALAWLALAGAALIMLLDQAAQLSETSIFAAWDSALLLATQTFSGQATTGIIGLGLIAAVLSLKCPAFVTPVLPGFALATAVRAAMGHAGEAGIFSLPVLVEWLHLAAMSLWVGCVIISGWSVFPALDRIHESGNAVRSYAARLSSWATVALAIIILTGVFNTGRVLENYSDLVYTGYGNLLLAKIVLALVALSLGGLNRIKGLPALGSAPLENGLRRFTFVLKAESLVLAAVVVLAAVLTNVSPHG